VRVFSLFAAAAAALIGAATVGLMLVFRAPADRHALEVTAVVVLAVHLFTFGLARILKPGGVWVAWLSGSALRLATLVVYALLVAKVLAFPLAPALIGCATFLFLPTLIEPLFLLK
jgi:hypothetical protein